MPISVLLEFSGSFPSKGGEWKRIFNADFGARELASYMKGREIDVWNDDLWNDFGWLLFCNYGDNKFAVYLAKYEEDGNWECTIKVEGQPGILQKFIGKKSTPYLEDLKHIALAVQQWVSESKFIADYEFSLSNEPKLCSKDILDLNWKTEL